MRACARGWHRCCALRVAGSVFCRGVWAFPSQWGGARGIVCRAWLRSKRDVRVVVVSAHPQVSCAVRGADRGGGAGCRCGLCGTLGRRAGSWRRCMARRMSWVASLSGMRVAVVRMLAYSFRDDGVLWPVRCVRVRGCDLACDICYGYIVRVCTGSIPCKLLVHVGMRTMRVGPAGADGADGAG